MKFNKKMEKMEVRAGSKDYFKDKRIKNNLDRRKKEINKKIFSQRIPPSPPKNIPIIIPKNGSVSEGKEEIKVRIKKNQEVQRMQQNLPVIKRKNQKKMLDL